MDHGGFEAFVRAELRTSVADVELYVLDEIGKMESVSSLFVEWATQALDSGWPALATVAAKGGGFIGSVKSRAGVEIVQVSAKNRTGFRKHSSHGNCAAEAALQFGTFVV